MHFACSCSDIGITPAPPGRNDVGPPADHFSGRGPLKQRIQFQKQRSGPATCGRADPTFGRQVSLFPERPVAGRSAQPGGRLQVSATAGLGLTPTHVSRIGITTYRNGPLIFNTPGLSSSISSMNTSSLGSALRGSIKYFGLNAIAISGPL